MLGMFDPFSTAGDTTGDLQFPNPYSPGPPASPVDTGAGDGFDWTAFGQQIPKLLGATSGLVSAIKGQPYTAGPYGISGGGLYPQSGYGLASGGIGISTTTLILIAGAVLLFMAGRR